MARLEEEVQQLTERAFAAIEPGVEVDYIDAVAAPVPIETAFRTGDRR